MSINNTIYMNTIQQLMSWLFPGNVSGNNSSQSNNNSTGSNNSNQSAQLQSIRGQRSSMRTTSNYMPTRARTNNQNNNQNINQNYYPQRNQQLNSNFISQVPGESNVAEDAAGLNANCGPACVAMLLRMSGVTSGNANTADGEIESARNMMGGGQNQYKQTDKNHLLNGLRNAGVNASFTEDKENFMSKIKSGRKAIALVNPSTYSNAPSANHFVVINKVMGDMVEIYDPFQQRPITISMNQLNQSMQSSEKETYAVTI